MSQKVTHMDAAHSTVDRSPTGSLALMTFGALMVAAPPILACVEAGFKDWVMDRWIMTAGACGTVICLIILYALVAIPSDHNRAMDSTCFAVLVKLNLFLISACSITAIVGSYLFWKHHQPEQDDVKLTDKQARLIYIAVTSAGTLVEMVGTKAFLDCISNPADLMPLLSTEVNYMYGTTLPHEAKRQSAQRARERRRERDDDYLDLGRYRNGPPAEYQPSIHFDQVRNSPAQATVMPMIQTVPGRRRNNPSTASVKTVTKVERPISVDSRQRTIVDLERENAKASLVQKDPVYNPTPYDDEHKELAKSRTNYRLQDD